MGTDEPISREPGSGELEAGALGSGEPEPYESESGARDGASVAESRAAVEVVETPDSVTLVKKPDSATAGEGSEPAAQRADALELLTAGEIELIGQLVDSSNETFLVELRARYADGAGEVSAAGILKTDKHATGRAGAVDGTGTAEYAGVLGSKDAVGNADVAGGPRTSGRAIYKPELGEAPLHDFPPGLYRRERAAYLLSEALGWSIVPPTVIREDAPFGVGSLQWFVDSSDSVGWEHYFTLYEEPALHDDFRRIAVFDFLTNNTDRKSGHVLRGSDGKIWAIDHGLCFSATFKLRTVIWDFAGEPIAADLLDDVGNLIDEVPCEVAELLSEPEVRALQGRARYLFGAREFPIDVTGRRFPWPLV